MLAFKISFIYVCQQYDTYPFFVFATDVTYLEGFMLSIVLDDSSRRGRCKSLDEIRLQKVLSHISLWGISLCRKIELLDLFHTSPNVPSYCMSHIYLWMHKSIRNF